MTQGWLVVAALPQQRCGLKIRLSQSQWGLWSVQGCGGVEGRRHGITSLPLTHDKGDRCIETAAYVLTSSACTSFSCLAHQSWRACCGRPASGFYPSSNTNGARQHMQLASWPQAGDAHRMQGRQWWTSCLCTAYVAAPLRRGAAWEARRPLAAPRCESSSVCRTSMLCTQQRPPPS